MARAWRYWDLVCRKCKVRGELGICVEPDQWGEPWGATWKNFHGITTREGPQCVQCTACRNEDVEMTERLQAQETSADVVP